MTITRTPATALQSRPRRARVRLAAVFVALASMFTIVGGVGVSPASAHLPGTNGCTAVPDSGYGFDFHNACDSHDLCYLNKPYGTDSAGRKTCDQVFYSAMRSYCNRHPYYSGKGITCRTVARTYYYGVRVLGAPFWYANIPAPIG